MKMLVTNLSLIERLSKCTIKSPILVGDIKSVTYLQLIEQALDIRFQFPALQNSVVALRIDDPVNFITGLCAMDGFASKILVLPPDILSMQKDNLIVEHSVNFQLNFDDRMYVESQCISGATLPKNDTQWILATSGTSGEPKLISHSLESLTRTVKYSPLSVNSHRWGLLYAVHRFAGLQVILQSLLTESVLVVTQETDLQKNIQWFKDNAVTALSATPSMWRQLLMVKDIEQLKLNNITLGGEIADNLILTNLKSTFNNATIRHIYASTEAGVGLTVVDGEAGFPYTWLNESTRSPQLKINNENHLMVKPEAFLSTSENYLPLDAQGYYDTGDIVTIDDERVLFVGRDSGVINVGGNKVYPEYVESIIRQFNNVLDVRVFGQSNAMMGQLVAADLVLRDKIDDEKLFKQQLIIHCKKTLSKYQIPMLLFFKTELATNAANKINRGC